MRRNAIRRAAYLIALTLACGAFGFALAGIAGTQGRIQPDGRAAELLKQHDEQVHGDCPFATDKAV